MITTKKSRPTSLVTHFFPFGGLLIAASHSLPFVSSLSERLPLEYISITSGASSTITLTESSCQWLTILTLPKRREGTDEQLVAAVSKGMLDLMESVVLEDVAVHIVI
jgi:hypothetical protein